MTAYRASDARLSEWQCIGLVTMGRAPRLVVIGYWWADSTGRVVYATNGGAMAVDG